MFMAHVEAMPIISLVECHVAQESPFGIWYLDSGYSNHITRNLELFYSLDKSVQNKVTLGTNIQVIVFGKENINILTKQGEKKFVPDVYYVSCLNQNLMSIGKLLQKGHRIYMEDNHCVILDKYPRNQLIAIIHKIRNIMFPLTLKPSMQRKKVQVVYKEKYVQSGNAFKEEIEKVSAHCSKEEKCSAHSFKKVEDNGAELQTIENKVQGVMSTICIFFISFRRINRMIMSQGNGYSCSSTIFCLVVSFIMVKNMCFLLRGHMFKFRGGSVCTPL